MRRIHFLIIAVFLVFSASAQRNYYAFFETENGKPFYIRMQDQILSSSGVGFLVLPRLTDSVYQVIIGFAGSNPSEAAFQVQIRGRDRGFVIKTLDGQLVLFDKQAATLIRPDKPKQDNSGVSYIARTDDFTLLLSKAADDPSLLWMQIVNKKDEGLAVKSGNRKGSAAAVPEPVKNDTATETAFIESDPGPETQPETKIQTEDSSGEQQITVTVPETVADPVAPAEEIYRLSEVRRYSESSTSEGFGLVYFDKHENGTDTIRLVIPNPRMVLVQAADSVAARNEQVLRDISARRVPVDSVIQGEDTGMEESMVQETEQRPVKRERKTPARKEAVADPSPKAPVFLDISIDPSDDTEKQADGKVDTAMAVSQGAEIEEGPMQQAAGRNNCRVVATDNDFIRLRRLMVSRDSDEGMLNEAKKFFRNKCVTTSQVKHLSALFLTAAGKYQFFDAAYAHVSDAEQFHTLESEIDDAYYLKRFRALIGE